MQEKVYTFVYNVNGTRYREKFTTRKTLTERETLEYLSDCIEKHGRGVLFVWRGKRGKIKQYRA